MLTIERLADEITTLAAHISAATARWLALLAEFDSRGGWGPGGFKSCAHWVAWSCSMSPSAAREHVRVAHRLAEMPAVAAAFSRGELSYSKVRALTRVENVSDESELIELARCASAAQLEQIVRGYRTVLAVESGEERLHAERYVSWSYDDEGALVIRGRMPAEQGALVVAALEAARDELGVPGRAEDSEEGASAEAHAVGEQTPVGARNADALVALAGASLGSGAGTSSAEHYQAVVHVDVAQLAACNAGGSAVDGRCELENGVPLAPEAARRLGCDASLVRIVERDGKPLSVGRRTRSIPPAMRRALRARDGGCGFPGCTQHRHVDAHHIHHWAARRTSQTSSSSAATTTAWCTRAVSECVVARTVPSSRRRTGARCRTSRARVAVAITSS